MRLKGIVSFASEFQPRNGNPYGESQSLNFCQSTDQPVELPADPPRDCYFHTFNYCLENSIKDLQSEFSTTAVKDCFHVLTAAYRMTAADWRLTNAYLDREVITIEYILEKTENNGTFQLERCQKDLFAARRQCAQYIEWVAIMQKQCRLRGQLSWPRDQSDGRAKSEARLLQEDFDTVQVDFEASLHRIDKCLEFFPTFVSLLANRDIGRLTLIATMLVIIFTPMSTIAVLLTMPGRFSLDGGESRWMVFVISAVVSFPMILVLSSDPSRVVGLINRSLRIYGRRIGRTLPHQGISRR
jgi:hypothetical protein